MISFIYIILISFYICYSVSYSDARIFPFSYNLTNNRLSYHIGDVFGIDEGGTVTLRYTFKPLPSTISNGTLTNYLKEDFNMKHPGYLPYFVLLSNDDDTKHNYLLLKAFDLNVKDMRLIGYNPEQDLCTLPSRLRYQMIPDVMNNNTGVNVNFNVNIKGYYHLYIFHCNKIDLGYTMIIDGNVSVMNPHAGPNKQHASFESFELSNIYISFAALYLIMIIFIRWHQSVMYEQIMPAHKVWVYVAGIKFSEMFIKGIYFLIMHTFGLFLPEFYTFQHAMTSISTTAYICFLLLLSFGFSFLHSETTIRDFMSATACFFFLVFSSFKNALCKQTAIIRNEKVYASCMQFEFAEHSLGSFCCMLISGGFILTMVVIRRNLRRIPFNDAAIYQYQVVCAYQHLLVLNAIYLLSTLSVFIMQIYMPVEFSEALIIMKETLIYLLYSWMWLILIRHHVVTNNKFTRIESMIKYVAVNDLEDDDLDPIQPSGSQNIATSVSHGARVIYPLEIFD